jgi:hypothetical protein
MTCEQCGEPIRRLLPPDPTGKEYIHARFGEEEQDLGHPAIPSRNPTPPLGARA